MEPILKSRYKIGEKLSENPFSVTYKGFFVGTENPVIIKIYKRGTLNSVLIKNMRQKVRELSFLKHPGLAKLLDGDYGWQGFYYVREYIEGETLQDIKKFDLQAASNIIIEVCKALEVTHKAGIVHGALSPSNIFIDRKGTVKVADFIIQGEIKEAQPMKALSLLEGAPYLSPEELEGRPASPRSDIYALGLILFEMLTGQKPFTQEKLSLSLNKFARKPLTLHEIESDFPRYLEEIILKSLERNPALRFPAVIYLRESLENKGLVLPPPSSEKLVSIFESSVYRYGEEKLPEEVESIEEVGRIKLKWSKEKHRTWILAMVIAVAVISGLLYAFFFVK